MKKSKLLLSLLTVGIISLSSCSVVKTTSTTVKTIDINGAVTHFPVVVDLNVKETKVTGEASGMSTSIESIKQSAVANAISTANADVLVEPIYKMRSSNGRTTVSVTGYPATYKNFRKIQKEDIELLKY